MVLLILIQRKTIRHFSKIKSYGKNCSDDLNTEVEIMYEFAKAKLEAF